VSSKCDRSITNQELERLDEMISFVLNSARKYVEGNKRNVPYSQRKVQLRMKKQYYRGLVKQRQGARIDQGALNKKKRMAKIGEENLTMEELKQKLQQAENQWEEYKMNAESERKKELLDSYPQEIIGDNEEATRRRKKAIQTVKKANFRQDTFDTLTKLIGKGEKHSLKRVKVIGEDEQVIKECQDREEIENEIAKYNKQHFRQAYTLKAFQDKIYPILKYDNIRDKILRETVKREECDDDDVYDFIQLLKKRGRFVVGSNKMAALTEEEWISTVKKSKRRSTSSVFSKRTYSVYKCTLSSHKMTIILVTFYNAVLKKGYCLQRWIKLLAVILEKGKGPIIGKLRTIKLIEGDLQILMRIFIGGRNDRKLEDDPRLSKFNYGSR